MIGGLPEVGSSGMIAENAAQVACCAGVTRELGRARSFSRTAIIAETVGESSAQQLVKPFAGSARSVRWAPKWRWLCIINGRHNKHTKVAPVRFQDLSRPDDYATVCRPVREVLHQEVGRGEGYVQVGRVARVRIVV
jgi:hypothetical protein